jgi:hypothetical protein
MSTSRHLLLLAGAQALALSCASRPELARSQAAPALSVIPAWVAAAQLRPRQAPADNPYAPIRSLNAPVYSWQSEKRVACAPEIVAAETEAAPRAAPGVFAAFPERTSDAASKTLPEKAVISPELVIARLHPALHQCFSRWLEGQTDAQGSANFALELGCAGEVEAISAQIHGVDSSTVTCLFSAIAPAQFTPPAGGHATVRVPVIFKNAAR